MNMRLTRSVTIRKNPDRVFQFLADLEKDGLWRSEVNKTVTSGHLQPGMKAYEFSRLSKKHPNYLMRLTCVELIRHELVVFETVPGSRHYFKSERRIEVLSDSLIKVSYGLEFDPELVQMGKGISLPLACRRLMMERRMKKQLARLKQVLEHTHEARPLSVLAGLLMAMA